MVSLIQINDFLQFVVVGDVGFAVFVVGIVCAVGGHNVAVSVAKIGVVAVVGGVDVDIAVFVCVVVDMVAFCCRWC